MRRGRWTGCMLKRRCAGCRARRPPGRGMLRVAAEPTSTKVRMSARAASASARVVTSTRSSGRLIAVAKATGTVGGQNVAQGCEGCA